MNGGYNGLSFDVLLQDADFQRKLKANESRTMQFGKNVTKELTGIENSFRHLGQAAAGYLAFSELAGLPNKLIQVRGEFQALSIAYTTMLGSKSKADALMKDVVKFAAQTPFNLKEVASASKQLLAYGFVSEDVTKKLTKLGDISAGLSIPLGELTELYGKTKTNGRLFAEDLNQYVGRGIPLIQLLADQFKVAESDVRGLVEAGKIGFPEVEKAINKLTDAGGMFSGLMAEQSKGLLGLYANFEDTVEQVFNKVGQSQEGLLGDSIKFATVMVEHYEDIGKVLGILVTAYGTYRAALIATAAVQSLPATITAVNTFVDLARSIRSAGDAQAFFNLVTKANPYVIAATALIALVTALALYRDTATEAEKAQELFNESIKQAEDEDIARKISIDKLTKSVKDETKSQDERKKKLQELIALSPKYLNGLTLENIATNEGTKAIIAYVEAMKERSIQEKIYEDRQKTKQKLADLKAGKLDSELGPSIVDTYGAALAQGGGSFMVKNNKNFDAQKEIDIQTRKNREAAIKELEEYDKKQFDLQQKGISERRKLRLEESKDIVLKTENYYDAQIKSLKDQASSQATSLAQRREYNKQIEELESKKRAITGEQSPSEKAASKAAEKAAKDEKEVAIKTFAEELEEKKNAYILYQRWIDHYGQEAADNQFSGLLSKNKTYIDYLNSELSKIEFRKNDPEFSDFDIQNVDQLNREKVAATGGKSTIEQYKDDLDAAKESASSLTQYLADLKEKQDALNISTPTSDILAMRQITAEEMINTKKERNKSIAEYLVSVEGSEQKRVEIERFYGKLRTDLEAEFGADKGEAYQKALDEINKREQDENQNVEESLAKKSKEYQEFFKIVQKGADQLNGSDIDKARSDFREFTKGLSEKSEEYKKYLNQLNEAEAKYKEKSIKIYGLIGNTIGELGQIMESIGGSTGEIGATLSGLAGQFSNVQQAMTAGKDSNGNATVSMNQYAAAIQGVITMISALVAASKKRHEAEKAFALARLGFENDYQLALNESIGKSYQKDQNPYVTDVQAKIDAGIKQQEDAQDKLNKSLEKLEEGKAKIRQKNVVDAKTTGQLVGAGAAAGAVIGGIVGVGVFSAPGAAIGAAIGAGVGLITGLFAKKKKEVFGGLLDQYPDLILEGADGWNKINVELAKALIANDQVDAQTKEWLQTTLDYNEQLEEAAQTIQDGIVELTGQIGNELKDALVNAFAAGEGAAEAFSDTVGNVIAKMVQDMLFVEFMKPALDRFMKEAKESMSEGGDKSLIDDLVRYKDYGKEGALMMEAGQQALDLALEASGFKPRAGSTASKPTATPLQGFTSGVSENTASMLDGSVNALRISQAEATMAIRQQLFVLNDIKGNTQYLVGISATQKDVLAQLKRMEASGNGLRAKGIDDIGG